MTTRRLSALVVEYLETRQMLTVGPVAVQAAIPAPYYVPTDTNLLDAQHGPMANLGSKSISIYQTFGADFAASVAAGQVTPAAAAALASQIAAQFPTVKFDNGSVGMDINSLGGDFNQFVTKLKSLGMVVTASSSDYGIAEGWVPIDELPTIARLPQTEAGSPILAPIDHAFTGFQGVAYNEGETSLTADAARSQYGLTGAGVTVGVLSDSVTSVGGGLQDSYNRGDLNPANPVYVIPGQAGSGEDEGRAMLESIHDIAPGANLQFATGGPGDLGFMQNIEALYNAGSKVIVDDISQSDEPFFQDGLIAQGVDYVTARGDAYFTSSANSGSDQGYLSTFRPVTATVGSGGSQMSGRFQNFNGGTGAASSLLPVTSGSSAGATITFQYDQPFKTQEPAGATASVTSDMSIYVFDASGNLLSSGTDDNVATQMPYQTVTLPKADTTYYVAIKLVTGTAPGHVEFVGLADQGAFTVGQQYGSAGGTYYPSSEGHEVSANTIGVGATPWWASSPFLGQNPLLNESSSSTGPGLIDLSPKGTPITPQLVQNPAITGPDGNSTSFFGQLPADTTVYNPATSYNYFPTGQQNNKIFFGTSEAAPNLAALAALMIQETPTLNRVQILQAMENTATPMNGTPAGQWNVQSGYGFVGAIAAIKAIAPPTTLTATTTTASSSTTMPVSGATFILSATVAGATPTGSVDFYDISYNTDLTPTPVALAGGAASFSTSTTTLGAHVYLVTYNGDSSHAKSTAYVVLDVVAPPSPKSAKSNSTKLGASASSNTLVSLTIGAITPYSLPIPLTLESATPAASQAVGDVTVGNTATAATESNPLVKKHSTM